MCFLQYNFKLWLSVLWVNPFNRLLLKTLLDLQQSKLFPHGFKALITSLFPGEEAKAR